MTKLRFALPVLLLAATAPPKGDDFRHGLGQWRIEAEAPAKVGAKDGVLDIDSPKGISLWYRSALTGPVRIEFDAFPVSEGGPDDAVSDVNAFWMAHDVGSADIRPRSGAFADYDDLLTYYVGIGGNRNTSTRFRRYIGQPGNRPLLPEHDRSDAPVLLQPNRWTHVVLIADGHHIAVERDGTTLFTLEDREPYSAGHFALRTTKSHLRIRNLTIR
jgi:hypothetical protein